MNSVRGALLLPLLAAPLWGSDGLSHARFAQALLGPGVWSRVLRIEPADGRGSDPVYAVVFELSGILWIYRDSAGTESLSRYWGRLGRDEADLGPLLTGIDPGFARYQVLSTGVGAVNPEGRLPEGCFIESFALWRERRRLGLPTPGARLLTYYVRTADGLRGHTVLQFATHAGVAVIDPNRPRRAIRIRLRGAVDAARVARRLRSDIESARWVQLDYVACP